MKKEGEFAEMTLGHLKRSPNHIELLYTQLLSIMKPPLNLSLPFDTKKNVRMKALRERLDRDNLPSKYQI